MAKLIRLLISVSMLFNLSVVIAQSITPLEIKTAGQHKAGHAANFFLTQFESDNIADQSGYSPKIPDEFIVGDEGVYNRDQSTTVIWDFGDGSKTRNTGERVSAAYVYKSPGDYTVQVKLLNSNNIQFAQASLPITIEAGTVRSTFSALPINLDEPTRLKFVGSTFQRVPGDDEVFTYKWDFGDGDSQEGEGLDVVNHTYAVTGEYKTRLTITSSYGGNDNTSKTIKVEAANSNTVKKSDNVLEAPDVINDEVNLRLGGDVNGEIKAISAETFNYNYLVPEDN